MLPVFSKLYIKLFIRKFKLIIDSRRVVVLDLGENIPQQMKSWDYLLEKFKEKEGIEHKRLVSKTLQKKCAQIFKSHITERDRVMNTLSYKQKHISPPLLRILLSY